MKKILLFCTGVLLLAGCQSPYENAGVGSYGYTYDLNLPPMVGSPGPLRALETTPPGYAVVTPGPAVQTSFGAPAQSVVFYEGSQPAQTVVPGVATTPVWTAPTAVAPGVPSGAPAVNEAAGAAVGAPAAPAAGAAPQGAVPYGGGYYGDGGVTIIGSNGLPTSVSNNVFVPTNINIVVTNGMTNMITNTVPTNTVGNTNGSLLSTNFSGGATNNPTATTTPGAPVAGATNSLNNLPRADATAAGTAGGTTLVPARPLGSAPTPAQSQAINPPTQPGPTTSTTSGGTTTEAAGAATGTTTVTGGHVPVGSPGAQPTGIGISSGGTTPSSSAAVAQQRQRVLLQQRAMQQQQQQQQAAPAAPAAAPK